MNPAILHFCKPKSKLLILSAIIMILQGLKYSHSVIECGGYIYESTFPYAKKTKLEDWLKKYTIVESHPVTVDYKKMESMLGAYYSIPQLLWALFDIKRVLNGARGLVCTEFCLRSMGYETDADNFDLIDLKTFVCSLQFKK